MTNASPFTWTRMDGTNLVLTTAAEFVAAIDQFDAELSALPDIGQVDRAVAAVSRFELFVEWVVRYRVEIETDIQIVDDRVTKAFLQAAWLSELKELGSGQPPAGLSMVQQVIFKGAVIKPRSWQQACNAIALIPELRAPDRLSLDEAIANATKVDVFGMKLIDQMRELLDHLSIAVSKPAEWDAYRTGTFGEYLTTRKLFINAVKRIDG